MKTHEWQPYLKILDIQEIDNFQPFKYVYAISQTQKAILFKLKNHLTSFVPKSVLRIDNHGVSPNGKNKKSVIVIPNELIPLKQKIALAKLSIKEIFQSNQKVKTASQISLLTWEYYKKYLEK